MTNVTDEMLLSLAQDIHDLAQEVHRKVEVLNREISSDLLPTMREVGRKMETLHHDLHGISGRLTRADGKLARIEQRLCNR